MIIGISMGDEICLIIGQVSLNLFYWRKTSKRIYAVREEINEKTAYIQARSFMVRTLERICKKCARQFQRSNAQNALRTSLERINPADIFTDGNWIFSQS